MPFYIADNNALLGKWRRDRFLPEKFSTEKRAIQKANEVYGMSESKFVLGPPKAGNILVEVFKCDVGPKDYYDAEEKCKRVWKKIS